jgi:small subunit ribosomal protein S3
MGHKTHPLGFRLGITQDHKSSWYSKLNSYSQLLKEDNLIRSVILDSLSDPTLKSTGITKILIYRKTPGNNLSLEVQTAKPGVLVGTKGFRLKEIDTKLTQLFPTKKTIMDIVEITDIYYHADLLADMLVIQLENRIPFRRAMKAIIKEVQDQNKKIDGIKIQIAGRVNGAEIARTEWVREGRVPLQTLRADIDYSYKTAQTIYGILGIKIWLFKGDIIGTKALVSKSL